MTLNEARQVITERRDYLNGRIRAKQEVGREYQSDERERDALTCMLENLRGWYVFGHQTTNDRR